MGKKILKLVGDYVEDYEAMVPFQMLLMVGCEVHAVCPDKKAGDTVKTAIHDFEGDQTYSEKPGHNFAINATFDEVKPEDYDGLVIPGGRAPEYIRLNERVLDICEVFCGREKTHRRGLPRPAGSGRGRSGRWTHLHRLSGRETRPDPGRRNLGRDQRHLFQRPTWDGNLVTAPAWPAHPEWIRKFLDLLGAKIEI